MSVLHGQGCGTPMPQPQPQPPAPQRHTLTVSALGAVPTMNLDTGALSRTGNDTNSASDSGCAKNWRENSDVTATASIDGPLLPGETLALGYASGTADRTGCDPAFTSECVLAKNGTIPSFGAQRSNSLARRTSQAAR
jgi:hypothetical protein